MNPPASAARALHDIIATVDSRLEKQKSAPYHAWQAVVGHEIPTAEFARYHAEAMRLFGEVAEQVSTLAPSAQARFEIYIPRWWYALTRPLENWAQDAPSIIEPAALHMLGALADVLEGRALSLGPPNPHVADVLRNAVALLLAEIEGDTELPFSVRDQILADLRHVLWLLDHVATFGVDHAVAAVERVTGKVVVAATTTRSEKLKRLAIGLCAALTMISGATKSVDTIVSDVKHTFGITAEESQRANDEELVTSTVAKVYQACMIQALPPAPSGPSSVDADADEPIEGEIVENDKAGRG